jgi:hypothetical protein
VGWLSLCLAFAGLWRAMKYLTESKQRPFYFPILVLVTP